MSGLGRPLAAGAAGLTLLVVLLGAAAAGAIGGILGGAGTQVAPSATATAELATALGTGPAGPVWLTIDTEHRRRLIDLPASSRATTRR